MTATHAKLIVAGTVMALAIGYLGFAGAKSGWVYMVEVDKYLADPQFRTQRVRLHGTVAADQLEVSPAALLAKFNLAGTDGSSLPVVYRGNIPEMFGAGKNVLVEGRSDDAGVFQADVLMTKCASKYEPDSPHAEAAADKLAEARP